MKTLLGLLVCVVLSAQTLTTSTDVAGTASAVQIATSGTAIAVTVVALAANTGTVRCGDSAITSTRGVPIAAGGTYYFQPIPTSQPSYPFLRYPLANLYCLAQNGDNYSVILLR